MHSFYINSALISYFFFICPNKSETNLIVKSNRGVMLAKRTQLWIFLRLRDKTLSNCLTLNWLIKFSSALSMKITFESFWENIIWGMSRSYALQRTIKTYVFLIDDSLITVCKKVTLTFVKKQCFFRQNTGPTSSELIA